MNAASMAAAVEEAGLRVDGRAADQLRSLTIETGINRYAEGSCLIHIGHTKVMCVATVEDRVPPFLKHTGQGWVTAEYGMLPRATHSRGQREASRGKQSGRTQEIQRLIGRSLRAVTDLSQLGERQVTIDCDVLQADGGTRCAAITGGYVALNLALAKVREMGGMKQWPITGHVAAVSCGIVGGQAVLDLCYEEDSGAEADMNFVLTDSGGIVEIQGTAEERPFSEDQFHAMFGLARGGIASLCEAQDTAIRRAVEA